jgi:type II secretion system protein N
MIWSWIKTLGAILGLFILFLFLTFPTERLGPRIARVLEGALSQAFRMPPPKCEVTGFGFALPFGLKMTSLRCINAQKEDVVFLSDLRVIPLPFRQSVSGKMGEGSLHATSNFSPFSRSASQLSLQLEKIDLQLLSPSLQQFARQASPMIPGLEIEGKISGQLDLPLASLYRSSGQVDLKLEGLRLPPQNLLKFMGISEVKFSQAEAKLKLTQGRLEINTFSFLSDLISAKASGNFQFNENFDASNGSIELKWQVVASDALRSSPFGSRLLNAECPNPDAQQFCTKRMSRISDFTNFFSGGSF